MQANLLDITSTAWHAALERCSHDCHHTPAWLKTAERSERGRAFAVHVTNGTHELLVPFVRRELTDDLWDATSPYGYGGPLLSTERRRISRTQRSGPWCRCCAKPGAFHVS
ncbi:hypothetical protein ACTMU2_00415 [Cupriavidus basilensis]